jgi:hypothetical protein
MRLDRVIHADACVGDGEQDVIAGPESGDAPLPHLVGRELRRLDRQRAAVRHRVARVEREVDQHLIDLRRIGLHPAGVVGQAGLNLDALVDEPPNHLLDPAHGGVEVDDALLRAGLPASKSEEPVRELRGALYRSPDLVDVLLPRRPLLDPLRQELAVGVDDREKVVEVVGDAGSESAECVHLVRLTRPLLTPAERLFVVLPRRHVARDDEHRPAELPVVVADRVTPAREPACRLVGPGQTLLDVAALAIGGSTNLLGEGCPVAHRRAIDKALADEAGVPGEERGRVVGREDAAVAGRREDEIRRRLDQQPVLVTRTADEPREGALEDCGGEGEEAAQRHDTSRPSGGVDSRARAGDLLSFHPDDTITDGRPRRPRRQPRQHLRPTHRSRRLDPEPHSAPARPARAHGRRAVCGPATATIDR